MTNIDGDQGLIWNRGFLGESAICGDYKVIKLFGALGKSADVFLLQRLDASGLPAETIPGLHGSAEEALCSVGVCWRCGEPIVPGWATDPDYVCPKFRQ